MLCFPSFFVDAAQGMEDRKLMLSNKRQKSMTLLVFVQSCWEKRTVVWGWRMCLGLSWVKCSADVLYSALPSALLEQIKLCWERGRCIQHSFPPWKHSCWQSKLLCPNCGIGLISSSSSYVFLNIPQLPVLLTSVWLSAFSLASGHRVLQVCVSGRER